MPGLAPTPRTSSIVARLEEFVRDEVRPIQVDLDQNRTPTVPPFAHLEPDGRLAPAVWQARREVARRSAAAGFYTLHLPAEMGGGGLGRADMFFVEEALYCHGLGIHLAALAWTEGPSPMLRHLDAEQRERFLRPLASAETTAAFALTEEAAGSDVLAIRTRAERSGSEWVLSGHKRYITNAPYCDVAQVLAVTEPDAGRRSLSLFLVEADRPGFRRGPIVPTIMDDGMTGELSLDGIRVPDRNLVGEVGQGFDLAMTWINWRRLCRGGMCAGWGRFLLDRSISHARERQAFGGALGEIQAVQHLIADIYVDWYSMRSLSIAAQAEIDSQDPYAMPATADVVRLVSLVKLSSDEAFFRIADRAVQVHGAGGLVKGTPEEALFRIARNLRIPAGTDEIQRNAIAHGLGVGR